MEPHLIDALACEEKLYWRRWIRRHNIICDRY
jgi:hypothetical protein